MVSSMQVVMTLLKPASLPPMFMVIRLVLADSPPSWLLSTSVVFAPEQAAKSKLDTLCAAVPESRVRLGCCGHSCRCC